MKTMFLKKIGIVYTIVAIAIISGMLASCQQEELLYSCDPEINDWVTGNKDDYSNISRDELVKFAYDKQSALWVSFLPAQKAKIYQSKYKYLMELNNLSEKEKEYLTDLYRQITPTLYSSDKEGKKLTEFYEKWKNEVMDKFGWENIDVYFYAETWFTYDEFWKWVEFKKSPSVKTGKELNCDCISSAGCIGRGLCDTNNKCKAGKKKCGAASNEDCTGLCD